MTTIYNQTTGPPPSGVTDLTDRAGEAWVRLGDGRWWCTSSNGPPSADAKGFLFAEMAEWGPFRSPPTEITPEIRSAALGHTIAMLRLVKEHGTFEFPEDETSVLTIADNYARYLATGEHFE